MTDSIVPAAVQLAAKRGFVRTFTQSLASVIPITAIAIPTTGMRSARLVASSGIRTGPERYLPICVDGAVGSIVAVA